MSKQETVLKDILVFPVDVNKLLYETRELLSAAAIKECWSKAFLNFSFQTMSIFIYSYLKYCFLI